MEQSKFNELAKEIGEIMKISGESRGVAIKSHGRFVLKEKNEAGLSELEEAMKKAGHPIDYRGIREMDFYPLGMETATIVAARKIFDFDDEKIREMGAFESKTSLLVRVFMQYFISIEVAAKQVSKMWKKNYTVGNLEVREINNETRRGIMVLEDFVAHPDHCISLEGYFASVVRMVVGSEASCREEKCIHRGDSHHEFVISW